MIEQHLKVNLYPIKSQLYSYSFVFLWFLIGFSSVLDKFCSSFHFITVLLLLPFAVVKLHGNILAIRLYQLMYLS